MGGRWWRGLFSGGLWGAVNRDIYLGGRTVDEWCRAGGLQEEESLPSRREISLRGLTKAFPIIGEWFCWRIGNGRKVKVVKDPFIGGADFYKLWDELVAELSTQQ